MSNVQDYSKYIVKKGGTLTTTPLIHVYIIRINNRFTKLQLQTPEIMKLFGSTRKLIDKTKSGEEVPSLEVVEVVLV